MKSTVCKIIAVCISLLSIQASGQDIQKAYQKAVDGIFSGIPAEKVNTGILIERAPTFVNMYRYEGACKEKDTCNVKKWKQMYLQLNVAHLDNRNFNYDSRIIETDYSEKSETGNIPLGIIFYDYNRINPEALQKGLVDIDTIKKVVRDISRTGETPLETVTCFATSPMVEILPVGTYSFYIEPSLFISNKTQTFDKIEVDFGDGKGFVPLPTKGKVSASFEKSGIHTLTLQATLKGITYLSYSIFYVPKSNSIMRAPTAGTNHELTPDEFVPIYDKAGIKAQYGIWYRCNHDNTLRKPFLIVAGFDPNDKVRIQGEYFNFLGHSLLLERVYLYHVANYDGFLDRLREKGYDIILYRSTESDKSIIPNAMNLVELIKKINNEKTSDNELIVAGASMGGLVARYALTWMENQGIDDHQTKLFVSIDSPQNGANIPLGMQHMLFSLNNGLKGLINMDDLEKVVERQLGCPAARQMLLYHHTVTNGTTANRHQDRTTFLNNLSAIGYFPQKCQSIALSMGSGTAVNQGFSAGQTLLKKNTSVIENTFLNIAGVNALGNAISGLLASPSWTRLIWEFETKALPNYTAQTIYKGKISIKVTFFPIGLPIPITITEDIENTTITVNNTEPLDNAPGGMKSVHNLNDFDTNGYSDLLSMFGIITKEPNNDCFIPSYSALGLSIPSHTNIKSFLGARPDVIKINNNNNFYQNFNKSLSPFDYLYIEDSNMDHIHDSNYNSAFTSSMVDIMEDVIAPSHLNFSDKTIVSGQSVAYEAESITVNGNFVVESGGSLDMRAGTIILKPGFHAKAGSTVILSADVSWICPAGSIQSVSFFPLSGLSFEDGENTETGETSVPTDLITHETENDLSFFPNPVENILNI